LGVDSHIVVRAAGGRIFNWREVVKEVTSVSGVVSASPYTYNQALVRTDGGATGVLIKGIDPDSATGEQVASYLDSRHSIKKALTPSHVVDSSGGEDVLLPPLVIGRELARSFSLFEGSSVSVLAPSVSSTPFGLLPRYRRFAVTAHYQSGLVEYESGLAYTDIEIAQQFFELFYSLAGIEVRVRDIDRSREVTKRIIDKLNDRGGGFYVQDWSEKNKPLWDAIRLEKRAYFIILLLIIVMASFSIVTTLVLVVLEKRRDIAVLRTMGAPARSISRIFTIQGSIIGLVGVSSGLVLGYLGCLLLRKYGFPLNEKVFQMSELPVEIDPVNFVAVGAVAFLICFLATIYPARRASKFQPAELLRHD